MARFAQVFAPRDRVYFELFEEAGQNMLRSSTLLYDLLSDYPDNKQLAARSWTSSTRATGSLTTSSIGSTTRS